MFKGWRVFIFRRNRCSSSPEYAWAYNEAPWEDSEVEEFHVLQVHDFEPNVVWVNEEECLITFDTEIDIDYKVSGPDFTGGVYDKEDDRIYTFGTTTNVGKMTKTLTIELGFHYELENNKLKNIKEADFHIAGLADGIAVWVDENDH